MTTQPDCTGIEQANKQLDTRLVALDGEMEELINLRNGLGATDPQRPSVQKRIDDLLQEHISVQKALREGEEALRKCLEGKTE